MAGNHRYIHQLAEAVGRIPPGEVGHSLVAVDIRVVVRRRAVVVRSLVAAVRSSVVAVRSLAVVVHSLVAGRIPVVVVRKTSF